LRRPETRLLPSYLAPGLAVSDGHYFRTLAFGYLAVNIGSL